MTDQEPLVHRIAVAALVRDDAVLLGHRHPARVAYPDCWDLVGGHIEPGESAQEAVRRECREEIGVTILHPRPMPITVSAVHLEMHGFVVSRWIGEPRNLAPDEHDDLRWFPAEALPHLRMADAASVPDILAAIRSVG